MSSGVPSSDLLGSGCDNSGIENVNLNSLLFALVRCILRVNPVTNQSSSLKQTNKPETKQKTEIFGMR